MEELDCDFCVQQIDENILTNLIPFTIPNSLYQSRVNYITFQNPTQPFQDNILNIQNGYQNMQAQINNQIQNNKDQLIKYQSAKQYKFKLLQKQMEDKLMNQCTFKPKTNIKSNIKRDFGSFLKNQKVYIDKIQQRKQKISEEIQSKTQKFTFKPKISNKNSSKNKQNQVVFERLYQSKKQQQTKQADSFIPKINQKSHKLKRNIPIQQKLYQDAQQRKFRSIQKQNEKQQQKSTFPEQKILNPKSKLYMAQKLMKQYENALQSLGIRPQSSTEITKQAFIEILQKLRFLTKCELQQKKLNKEEISLIQQAYDTVCKTSADVQHVYGFLLALIGVYNSQNDNKSMNSTQAQLEEQNAKTIHKKFNIFYHNRLHSQQIGSIQNAINQCTFKPALNKYSEKLAEKNRKVKLEQVTKVVMAHPDIQRALPENKILSHAQFLILNKKVKDLQMQYIRQIKLRDSIRQCTFKPKILKDKNIGNYMTASQTQNCKSNDKYKSKSSSKSKSKTKIKKNQVLILDICFGQKQEQISLKMTDSDKLNDVAKFYAEKYCLSKENQIQLLDMLHAELNSVLFPQF